MKTNYTAYRTDGERITGAFFDHPVASPLIVKRLNSLDLAVRRLLTVTEDLPDPTEASDRAISEARLLINCGIDL